MAREQVLFDRSRTAAADLSGSQYKAVVLNTSSQVAVVGTAGVRIYGILINKPVAGNVADVRILGMTKALVGSAGVNAGDPVMADATGAITTATSGNKVIGWCEDTAAAGDLASLVLLPSGTL